MQEDSHPSSICSLRRHVTCELKCFSSELDGFSCVRLHQIRSLLCSWLIWLFVSGMMETSVAMAAQLTETMDTTHWVHSFHCLCSCSNHITCNFLHELFRLFHAGKTVCNHIFLHILIVKWKSASSATHRHPVVFSLAYR